MPTLDRINIISIIVVCTFRKDSTSLYLHDTVASLFFTNSDTMFVLLSPSALKLKGTEQIFDENAQFIKQIQQNCHNDAKVKCIPGMFDLRFKR